jgi:hypothetical protein
MIRELDHLPQRMLEGTADVELGRGQAWLITGFRYLKRSYIG